MTNNCQSKYLYETIPKVDSITEVVSLCQVAVQWLRVKLSQDVYFVDAAVDTVAHGYINKPVSSANRHLAVSEIDLYSK